MARCHQRGSKLHRRPLLVLVVVISCNMMSSPRPCGLFMPLSTSSTDWLLHRRAMLTSASLVAADALATQPALLLSSNCCYPVCKSQDEWQLSLSNQQFFILRCDGTDAPRSSPLLLEQRKGSYNCAACEAQLFSSANKFDARTGWPSFADGTSNVEVEQSWFEAFTGTKVKCVRCGSRIGERFLDGVQFPGTLAARSGRRYCINGAGLVFIPADGSAARNGEAPVKDAVEYWEQRPWRMIDGGLRPI